VKRRFRLTKSEDFKRVRLFGKSYAHPLIVLLVNASESPQVKIGISIGKSVGGAVIRNRTKRRMRAAVSEIITQVKTGWDIVLIGRAAARNADLPAIRESIRILFGRANLLNMEMESTGGESVGIISQ
jgi:ribonuclease P protein component